MPLGDALFIRASEHPFGDALNTRAGGQVPLDTLNIGITKACALTFHHGTPLDAVALSGSAPR